MWGNSLAFARQKNITEWRKKCVRMQAHLGDAGRRGSQEVGRALCSSLLGEVGRKVKRGQVPSDIVNGLNCYGSNEFPSLFWRLDF
jgi:hypothetical protein